MRLLIPPVVFLATASSAVAFDEAEYKSLATTEGYNVRLMLPMSVRTRFEGVEEYPLDRDGTKLGERFFILPEFRLGARFENIEPYGLFRSSDDCPDRLPPPEDRNVSRLP